MKRPAIFLLFFLVFLLFPSRAYAAKLTLDPDNKTLTSGEQFSVKLNLDTEGEVVNGVDVTLRYPSSIIWIDQVNFSSLFSLHLEKISKSEGKVTLNFSTNSQGGRFNGQGLLATLTVSTHQLGEAYLSFVCDATNDSDDTNIWQAGTNADLVSCSSLTKGFYQVQAEAVSGVSPSPAPICLPLNPPSSCRAASGPGIGQVTLSWSEVSNADYYTVTYGLVSHGYIYGAANIGKGTSYTVAAMAPGRRYYFVLTSVNNCGSSGYSAEVSARAGGSLPSLPQTKGGWQPADQVSGPVEEVSLSPEPSAAAPVVIASPEAAGPVISPEPEPGEATAPAEPLPSESPQGLIPAKAEPFWREMDFWKKVGLVAGAIFVLLLLISFLRGRGESSRPEEAEYPEAAPSGEAEADQWPPAE